MLGTRVDEFLKEMEQLTYPIHYSQQYLKYHFEILEKLHTPKILLYFSFSLDLKLESAKNAIWI